MPNKRNPGGACCECIPWYDELEQDDTATLDRYTQVAGTWEIIDKALTLVTAAGTPPSILATATNLDADNFQYLLRMSATVRTSASGDKFGFLPQYRAADNRYYYVELEFNSAAGSGAARVVRDRPIGTKATQQQCTGLTLQPDTDYDIVVCWDPYKLGFGTPRVVLYIDGVRIFQNAINDSSDFTSSTAVCPSALIATVATGQPSYKNLLIEWLSPNSGIAGRLCDYCEDCCEPRGPNEQAELIIASGTYAGTHILDLLATVQDNPDSISEAELCCEYRVTLAGGEKVFILIRNAGCQILAYVVDSGGVKVYSTIRNIFPNSTGAAPVGFYCTQPYTLTTGAGVPTGDTVEFI